MKVGTYTIAHQPDVPRNITVTHTAVGAADTLGTITVLGTDRDNKVISEVITPLAGTVASGVRAFKTITSITGAGWVIGAGNDTITIGVGTVLGLPFVISSTEFCYGLVGTANVVGTAVSDVELSKCTVDLSAGTYDGAKKVFAILSE
jgi:Ca2+-binding RTX toxin-like protein